MEITTFCREAPPWPAAGTSLPRLAPPPRLQGSQAARPCTSTVKSRCGRGRALESVPWRAPRVLLACARMWLQQHRSTLAAIGVMPSTAIPHLHPATLPFRSLSCPPPPCHAFAVRLRRDANAFALSNAPGPLELHFFIVSLSRSPGVGRRHPGPPLIAEIAQLMAWLQNSQCPLHTSPLPLPTPYDVIDNAAPTTTTPRRWRWTTSPCRRRRPTQGRRRPLPHCSRDPRASRAFRPPRPSTAFEAAQIGPSLQPWERMGESSMLRLRPGTPQTLSW
jgi:hypothetical protein